MFERYAIFYTPVDEFATVGAAWLGWDSALGCAVPHLDVAGVDVMRMTDTPRKYGLHATLKAPFRLAAGGTLTELQQVAAAFAARQAAFDIGALELRSDRGFVALRPQGAQAQLQGFATEIVKQFDHVRAPLTEADIARRRKANLTERQDRQMLDWGYPFIFDDFHFHLTLSGAVSQGDAAQLMDALSTQVMPVVPSPFVIDAITVMGQDSAGMFHQIQRYALSGSR